MRDVVNEVRYAARTLWSARVVSVATVLTLGIGIGLLTAVFSLVNAAVLRPLPYEDARRLVALDEIHPRVYQQVHSAVSPAAFATVRERARSFTGIAAYERIYPNVIVGTDAAQPTSGADVSPDLFAVLGATPVRGRTFTEDEAASGSNVALIAHELWMSRLGARESAIGSTIRVDGVPHVVIGVMPPGFNFPQREQFWRPLEVRGDEPGWLERSLGIVARLRDDVAITSARSEVATIGAAFAREQPATQEGWSFVVREDAIERRAIPGPLPWMILAAGTFLMLIACANVATVLLARAASRKPEMAVRAALGASRARLVRQLLTETGLLAVAGGVAGIVLGSWMLDIAWAAMPTDNFPAWIDVGVDWRVLAFTCCIAFIALFAIGVGPALTATRVRLSDPLKLGGAGDTASRRELRSSRALVIIEVAAAFVLFVGATLMLQNFRRLQDVDFGIGAEQVLVARPWLSRIGYAAPERRDAYFAKAVESVRRVPGVEVVATRGILDSLRGAAWTTDSAFARYRLVTLGTTQNLPSRANADIDWFAVSPTFMATLRLPLLRGRWLTDSDARGSARVAVVSALVAERFWPNADPIGRQFRLAASTEWMTVIGVAGDVRGLRSGPRGASAYRRPAVYLPIAQASARNSEILVRAADPLALAPAVARSLGAIDPDQSVGRMDRLSDALSAGRDFTLWLGIAFAAIATGALVLASIGLYGVIAYSVTRRTREIGVRMALGANATVLHRTVMGQALRLTSIGLGVGLVGALALVRLAGSFVASSVGITALSYLLVIAVFLGFGALASAIPARRATRVDPLVALRAQ